MELTTVRSWRFGPSGVGPVCSDGFSHRWSHFVNDRLLVCGVVPLDLDDWSLVEPWGFSPLGYWMGFAHQFCFGKCPPCVVYLVGLSHYTCLPLP